MARRKSLPKTKKQQGKKATIISKSRKAKQKKIKKADLKKKITTSKKDDITKISKPTLEKIIQMPYIEGESTMVDAIAVMSNNIMLIVTGTHELRVVDVKKTPEILSSYDLEDFCRLVKLDSNRAIVYYPYDKHKVDIFKVQPKLERINRLHLEQGYDEVAVTEKNLITVKYVDSYTTAFQILDTDGILLNNFRPKLLRNIGLSKIRSLHVTPTNEVVVIDGFTAMVYVLPLDGGLGFAYWGNDKPIHPIPSDITKNYFRKYCYRIESPVSLASDEDGNVYVGDKGSGSVTKFDSEGNFIQNVLPLDEVDMREYYIKLLYNKRHLYVFDDNDGHGKIHVYKI